MALFLKILAIFVICAGIASGLLLDLKAGSKRCLGQELDSEDSASFEVRYVSGHEKVKLTLMDPSGNSIETRELTAAQTLAIPHNIPSTGAYQMCFEREDSASAKSPVRVEYMVKISSKNSKDGQSSTEGDLSLLERQFKTAEKKLMDIRRELDFARRQENVNEDENTLWWVQIFGAGAVIVLLVTSVWQVYYLRSFFVSKKLI